ncbi:serpin B3-like [Leptodactylus fuscus]|uniref:serpin B3-like n=1 Tax=Leptodactylus fuscus TaxID=238119 RepID=UPI003F4EE045
MRDYVSSAQELYQTTVKAVDYQYGRASQEINSLVEAKTEGKIKNLLPENSLENSPSMVLVNVVSFNGQLEKIDTQVPVPMMSQTDTFNIGVMKEIGITLLEVRGKMSLLIILPKEIAGLYENEEKITPEFVMTQKNSANMIPTEMTLQLPRMELVEEYDLRGILKEHGMEDAFSPEKANLSGVSDQGLHVSHMIHKVVMDLNEGTEDAAPTTAVTAPDSLETPTIFSVDRPFMFFMINNENDTIIFQGRFVSP